jgi:hypothetical protein
MPLVVICPRPRGFYCDGDAGTPTPAVGLDPMYARQVAGRILALANEIDNGSRARFAGRVLKGSVSQVRIRVSCKDGSP